MEQLSFTSEGGHPETHDAVVVGVVASGNLEVMVEPMPGDARCIVDISTPARGFDDVWAAVMADFFDRWKLAGVRVSINDVGATPAVVSLRLDQAVEEFRKGAAP
ncbi:MAG: malonate decarboxylase acyl carrier protein [Burkholderiaceae bacterium]